MDASPKSSRNLLLTCLIAGVVTAIAALCAVLGWRAGAVIVLPVALLTLFLVKWAFAECELLALIALVIAAIFEVAWTFMGIAFMWGYDMRMFPYARAFIGPLLSIFSVCSFVFAVRHQEKRQYLGLAALVCVASAMVEVLHALAV